VVESQQAWYFGVLLHLDKLLCSAVVFRFTRSGRCVLFPSGCVQLQFDYKLVTWVAVVVGPSAMFTFVDFTVLAKWPFTSTLVSHAKTRAAHLFVLYGYYNNFIFSFKDRLEYIIIS